MPAARFDPFHSDCRTSSRGARRVVYRQAASTRGQRIEVLTIDSNISTGSFRNATDDSLTYQIKGQEKTVARGEIHRVGLQKGSRTRSAGCFGRAFWAGPRRPLDWPSRHLS